MHNKDIYIYIYTYILNSMVDHGPYCTHRIILEILQSVAGLEGSGVFAFGGGLGGEWGEGRVFLYIFKNCQLPIVREGGPYVIIDVCSFMFSLFLPP